MSVVFGETYPLKLYHRKKNSPFEYEEAPYAETKCRPSKDIEKRQFNIQSGVSGNDDDVLVIASNLKEKPRVGDRALYMGRMWSVYSVNVMLRHFPAANASIMDYEAIEAKAPKAIGLR